MCFLKNVLSFNFFETLSHVAKTCLELLTILPLCPECFDYRHVPTFLVTYALTSSEMTHSLDCGRGLRSLLCAPVLGLLWCLYYLVAGFPGVIPHRPQECLL